MFETTVLPIEIDDVSIAAAAEQIAETINKKLNELNNNNQNVYGPPQVLPIMTNYSLLRKVAIGTTTTANEGSSAS